MLERLTAAGLEEEITRRSGLPLDPYFSAAKLTWMLEELDRGEGRARARAGCGSARSTRSCATGSARVSRPIRPPRRACSSPRPGPTDFDPWLCETFGVPRDVLPRIEDTVGDLGTLRHPSWDRELPLRARLVDQQAALAGTGCVVPGMVKATYGTGVFVFAHAGTTVPEAGELLPTVAWRIGGVTEYALDGGVFAAGALLEWMSRKLGFAEDPQALAALARDVEDSGGVRVLPAIAGIGAPWWRPEARGVIAGLTAASGRAEVARAALEGIAWRVADVFEAVVGAGRRADVAGGRRAHERPAARVPAGRRDRRAGRAGDRGRDEPRRRAAGRCRRRRCSRRSRRRRSWCRSRSACRRSAMRRGGPTPTPQWRTFVERAAEL